MFAALEENIRGEFALSGHPIMLVVFENILQLRGHQLGIFAEELGPVQIGESIGELLRPSPIVDPEKGIIVLGIANAIGRLASGRAPFMAI